MSKTSEIQTSNIICWRMFQDTNEAEADNTDKEGDFNLKVSIVRACVYVLVTSSHLFILFVVTSWPLEKLFIKTVERAYRAGFLICRRTGQYNTRCFLFFFIIAE